MIPEVHIREAGFGDIDGMLALLKELFSWKRISGFQSAVLMRRFITG